VRALQETGLSDESIDATFSYRGFEIVSRKERNESRAQSDPRTFFHTTMSPELFLRQFCCPRKHRPAAHMNRVKCAQIKRMPADRRGVLNREHHLLAV